MRERRNKDERQELEKEGGQEGDQRREGQLSQGSMANEHFQQKTQWSSQETDIAITLTVSQSAKQRQCARTFLKHNNFLQNVPLVVH